MRRFFLPLVPASVLLLVSCGGGGPGSPTAITTGKPRTSPSITLTIVRGEAEGAGCRSFDHRRGNRLADAWRRKRNVSSDEEVLATHLMFRRYPGNRFPDRDREVNARGSRDSMLGRTPTVVPTELEP